MYVYILYMHSFYLCSQSETNAGHANFPIRVNHKREALRTIIEEFSVFCHFKTYYFPFDNQTCSIHLGSFSHASEIYIQIPEDGTKPSLLEAIEHSHEWEISSISFSNYHHPSNKKITHPFD